MDSDILKLIKWAREELKRSAVPRASRDAETLFMHSFDAKRENIYELQPFKVREDKVELFRQRVKLRASRLPLQYILKNTEFMGLELLLEEGVFIPRPETELLVEKVLENIKSMDKKRVNILELGTGCGNIAISLTKNASGCKIIASDIYDKALKIATKNARLHEVKKNIKFIKSNYFDKISPIYCNYFDIIVSNPPYIRRNDIKELEPELAYEDKRALDGGEDGLRAYKRILGEGTKYIKKYGVFIFEIGCNQASEIVRLIERDERFKESIVSKDYNGHDRVLIAKYHGRKRDKSG